MLGMSSHEIRIARKLATGLELRELPKLVGQRFDAASVRELEATGELLALVGLAGRFESEHAQLEATLVKYGFVDIRFGLTGWPQQLQRTGTSVVREFLDDPSFARQAEDDDTRRERVGCLDDICTEIDEGHRQLRVMADAVDMPEISKKERLRMMQKRSGPNFPLFPREFVVRDAYITNAPTAGIMRHFYL